MYFVGKERKSDAWVLPRRLTSQPKLWTKLFYTFISCDWLAYLHFFNTVCCCFVSRVWKMSFMDWRYFSRKILKIWRNSKDILLRILWHFANESNKARTYVFPRFPQETCFPALSSGYMFSRAFRRLHVFPRLPPVTCFPALSAGYMFSRAYRWLLLLLQVLIGWLLSVKA